MPRYHDADDPEPCPNRDDHGPDDCPYCEPPHHEEDDEHDDHQP